MVLLDGQDLGEKGDQDEEFHGVSAVSPALRDERSAAQQGVILLIIT